MNGGAVNWSNACRRWLARRSFSATTHSASSRSPAWRPLEAFRERVKHGLANATFEQRRQLVLLLVDRVIVTDAEVEIRYVLPTSPGSEHVRFCQLRKDYFVGPEQCRLIRRQLGSRDRGTYPIARMNQ
jgi:hypothetical protein